MPLFPNTSPWGTVDHAVSYGDGVYLVSTASHGGLALSAGVGQTIPAHYQTKAIKLAGWTFFEEDCAVGLVYEARPDLYRTTIDDGGAEMSDEELLADVKASNRRWYPELFGLPPNCAHCHGQHAPLPEGTLVAFAAYGAWHPDVPQGFVGVSAGSHRNGPRRTFLVSAAEYEQRDAGSCFVVDGARHRELRLAA